MMLYPQLILMTIWRNALWEVGTVRVGPPALQNTALVVSMPRSVKKALRVAFSLSIWHLRPSLVDLGDISRAAFERSQRKAEPPTHANHGEAIAEGGTTQPQLNNSYSSQQP